VSIPPSNEQVAVAWLQGIPALAGKVATVLPSNLEDWAETGFITVNGAGGTPHMYLPLARPVVSVHFWAVTISGSRPPWGMAANLYAHVRHDDYGVLDYDNVGRALTSFPAMYTGARVQNINFLAEPERRPGDPGDFAEYVANLELQWLPL
jgi:hypothetical protein